MRKTVRRWWAREGNGTAVVWIGCFLVLLHFLHLWAYPGSTPWCGLR